MPASGPHQRGGHRRGAPPAGGGARPARPPPARGRGTARPGPARRGPRGRAWPGTPISSSRSQTPAVERPGGAVPRGPHRVGRALLVQQVADRVAEGELVVGEGEAHASTPSAGRARARRRCCAGSRWCPRRSAPTARTASPSSTGPSTSAAGAEQLERESRAARTSSSDHQILLIELVGAQRGAAGQPGHRVAACTAGTPRPASTPRPAGRAAPGRRALVPVQVDEPGARWPGSARATAGSGPAPTRWWPSPPTSPGPPRRAPPAGTRRRPRRRRRRTPRRSPRRRRAARSPAR